MIIIKSQDAIQYIMTKFLKIKFFLLLSITSEYYYIMKLLGFTIVSTQEKRILKYAENFRESKFDQAQSRRSQQSSCSRLRECFQNCPVINCWKLESLLAFSPLLPFFPSWPQSPWASSPSPRPPWGPGLSSPRDSPCRGAGRRTWGRTWSRCRTRRWGGRRATWRSRGHTARYCNVTDNGDVAIIL